MNLKALLLLTILPVASAHALVAHSNQTHQMQIMNYGKIGLAKRLELIRSAQKRISMETFAFEFGPATRLIVQALVERANHGVKVEMTIDKVGTDSAKLSLLQKLLHTKNISIKVFNTKKLQLGFRTHRKLLIVDEERAIVGGRNNESSQYEIEEDLTAIDREVLLSGPIVKDIQHSFDIVHTGRWANNSFKAKVKEQDREVISHYLETNESDIKLSNDLARTTPQRSDLLIGTCDKITWATSTDKDNHQDILGEFYRRLKSAKKSIQVESPYFIPSRTQRKIMKSWLDKGINIEFLTNGALSSLEFHISLANYDAHRFAKHGLPIRYFNGEAPSNRDNDENKLYRIHSKTYLIDQQSFVISSFNWDRRSEAINLEGTLICDSSPHLGQQLSNYMHKQYLDSNTTEDFFENYDSSKALYFLKRLLVLPLRPLF
ncbi:MAG: hypothetical protein COW00_07750 [Bdellovibrio sp. CG12_big_fil_rev_8_21_14_0_65_39_13]|nr:MAG: hypothetical protein COW78_12430 [Bdellovibrio sp. CG22_combo_CG10-13_8_21_14_all_39_27]PIQ60150.1 MAG: hypothetical protein COW00_07750 [Bdellovibrio sp. CG12_big_fil_rev_8_21_14_0_65_39_13]PIR36785.1 MAG: hypothetical protein COV37_01250 [Bdellovibrio sp. CG11_big_fil_rev_8_21_14_0_20_39_38]PJB52655.1 MAG: hypothetical protein CO099_11435 [Bdellovibrio sp. CG_4_9_14_3_um_filter_39_7]